MVTQFPQHAVCAPYPLAVVPQLCPWEWPSGKHSHIKITWKNHAKHHVYFSAHTEYNIKDLSHTTKNNKQIHWIDIPCQYASGQKSVIFDTKEAFFKKQRAITLLLTDGVRCHLACSILLSIYILIPSFNEIRQSTSKIWLWTQKCWTDRWKDRRTDNPKTISLLLWQGIIR